MEDQTDKRLIRLRLALHKLDAAILAMLPGTKDPSMKGSTETVIKGIRESRNKIVLAIGELKQELGLETHHPEVEEQKIVDLIKIAEHQKLDLTPEEIRTFFSALFEKSRELQDQSSTPAVQ